jgi:hypothetical protein
MSELKLPELPEWTRQDDLGGLVPSEVRVAMLAIRDQGVAYGMELAAQIALDEKVDELDTGEEDDASYNMALDHAVAAIRAKAQAVQNTVQVSGKEGV